MELAKRVLKLIREEKLFPPGEKVLCGVSGGADSTALLCVLLELAPTLEIALSAVHINHCLRGEQSDGDELFVRGLCARLGVPLFVYRRDVQSEAVRQGIGIEECARNVRYQAFHETLMETGISYLSTAHNAKDNLETGIFNFIRGTAVSGIAGIPLKRKLEDCTVVRPLLTASREEIEEYLHGIGESYIVDSSNQSDVYARNYIRLHVLPLLEKRNPSLYQTAAATQRVLRGDADFIRISVEQAYRDLVRNNSLSVRDFKELHPAISGRLVMRVCQNFSKADLQLTAAHCAAVAGLALSDRPSAQVDLPGGVVVRREYQRLVFQRKDAPAQISERLLEIGKTTVFPEAGIKIQCSLLQKNLQNFRSIQNFYFDYSHICGILSVRARKSGDYIHLAGHAHGKTIKKAMIDLKIPHARRSLIPVICDGQGIIAVGEIGVSQRVAVGPETREVLQMQIANIDGGNANDDSSG